MSRQAAGSGSGSSQRDPSKAWLQQTIFYTYEPQALIASNGKALATSGQLHDNTSKDKSMWQGLQWDESSSADVVQFIFAGNSCDLVILWAKEVHLYDRISFCLSL